VRRLLFVGLLVALATPAGSGARDPKDPTARHTAADTALARAIVLRPRDLGTGWKAGPPPAKLPCAAQPSHARAIETGRAETDLAYQDGTTSVNSQAQLFRSSADARLDWNLSANDRTVKACAVEQLERGAAASSSKVVLDSFARLQLPKLAERTIGYRVAIRVTTSAQTVKAFVDLIAVGRGRAEAVTYFRAVGAPFSASGERSIAKRVASRLPA
jgi:hypothetical protein